MNRLSENIQIIIFLILLGGSALFVVLVGGKGVEVNNFEECVAVTGRVMESYPRQCVFEGQHFVEEIG